MNCDEMVGDRLTVCEQELLSAFARLVSIAQTSCFIIVSITVLSLLGLYYSN